MAENVNREQTSPSIETTRIHNPRLVFSDPDSFFYDLLMEQQEQE